MGDTAEEIELPLRGSTDGLTSEDRTEADDHADHLANGENKPISHSPEHVKSGHSESLSHEKQEENRCNCCPRFCYGNNVVMINSVLSCFAMIISVGILVGLTVTMARPHLTSLTYVEDNCTTISSNYTGARERCGCGGRFCAADYPCLEVIVEYKGSQGQMIQSMLHEEEHVFTYISHCSYQPENCVDGKNDLTIEMYKHKWGVAGKTFPCLHNPDRPGALRRRTRSVTFIIHVLVWPAVCALISTVLCCIVYCYCCPRSRVHKFGREKV